MGSICFFFFSDYAWCLVFSFSVVFWESFFRDPTRFCFLLDLETGHRRCFVSNSANCKKLGRYILSLSTQFLFPHFPFPKGG